MMRASVWVLALLMAATAAPDAVADHVREGAIRWACGSGGSGDRGHPDACGIDPVGGGADVGSEGEPEWGKAWIGGDELVLGVVVDGEAVAVPVKMGDSHEIINAEVGGTPIAITYCPLCGSGVTFDRRMGGHTLAFTASGFLWQSDLVMWDDVTGTLWTQIKGEAIGTLSDERVSTAHIDVTLDRIPTIIASWDDWKEEHPSTTMLQPVRDAYYEPYSSYKSSGSSCGLGGCSTVSDALYAKELVIGVVASDPVAFPLGNAQRAGVAVANVTGGQVVLSFTSPAAWTAYDSGGRMFTETPEGWVDQNGTAWDLRNGSAGQDRLSTLDGTQMFWFAWEEHHPETLLWVPGEPPISLVKEDNGRLPGFTIPIVLVLLVMSGLWWRWRR